MYIYIYMLCPIFEMIWSPGKWQEMRIMWANHRWTWSWILKSPAVSGSLDRGESTAIGGIVFRTWQKLYWKVRIGVSESPIKTIKNSYHLMLEMLGFTPSISYIHGSPWQKRHQAWFEEMINGEPREKRRPPAPRCPGIFCGGGEELWKNGWGKWIFSPCKHPFTTMNVYHICTSMT